MLNFEMKKKKLNEVWERIEENSFRELFSPRKKNKKFLDFVMLSLLLHVNQKRI